MKAYTKSRNLMPTIFMPVLLCLVLSGSAAAQAGLNYGVIFSGGADRYNNHDRYYEETLRMWNIMTGTLGYDVKNVYVLFADGTDPAIDRSSGVSSDWSMITAAGGNISSATYADLQNTLGTLQNMITLDDCFHFWSFDHGYQLDPPVQDQGGLVAWGSPWIADDVFASWVNPITAYAESYAFGQCFAGDMADDLNILPGQNRFAAWAADWYESSWGRGWADVWADALETGLRWTHDIGEYARLNDPYGPGGSGLEHPGWLGDNFHIITNEPIPEPATICLLGLGALSLLRRKGLKRNNHLLRVVQQREEC